MITAVGSARITKRMAEVKTVCKFRKWANMLDVNTTAIAGFNDRILDHGICGISAIIICDGPGMADARLERFQSIKKIIEPSTRRQLEHALRLQLVPEAERSDGFAPWGCQGAVRELSESCQRAALIAAAPSRHGAEPRRVGPLRLFIPHFRMVLLG
jgi:hypothetical protein